MIGKHDYFTKNLYLPRTFKKLTFLSLIFIKRVGRILSTFFLYNKILIFFACGHKLIFQFKKSFPIHLPKYCNT